MDEKTLKSNRKGKIVNVVLGEDIMSRIPRCMETVYKICAIPVDGSASFAGDDETLKLFHMRTILVEGTSVVNNGKALNINGEFEISLEVNKFDSEEKRILDELYRDKDEAISAWRVLTNTQVEKIEAIEKEVAKMKAAILASRDEEQY